MRRTKIGDTVYVTANREDLAAGLHRKPLGTPRRLMPTARANGALVGLVNSLSDDEFARLKAELSDRAFGDWINAWKQSHGYNR